MAIYGTAVLGLHAGFIIKPLRLLRVTNHAEELLKRELVLSCTMGNLGNPVIAHLCGHSDNLQ